MAERLALAANSVFAGLLAPVGPTPAGVGPSRWLAVCQSSAGFVHDLEAALDVVGSVIAQTDGLAVLRISGPRARDMFAKGLPIDLDASVFDVGDVASSILAHIAITIWRTDETAWEVAVPRSFASDFWHWLAESAAEFGLAVGEGAALAPQATPDIK